MNKVGFLYFIFCMPRGKNILITINYGIWISNEEIKLKKDKLYLYILFINEFIFLCMCIDIE